MGFESTMIISKWRRKSIYFALQLLFHFLSVEPFRMWIVPSSMFIHLATLKVLEPKLVNFAVNGDLSMYFLKNPSPRKCPFPGYPFIKFANLPLENMNITFTMHLVSETYNQITNIHPRAIPGTIPSSRLSFLWCTTWSS